jgi:hypothetical protein
MTVKELIEALSKCRNQDAEVFAWDSGNRAALDSVDDWADAHVDINLKEIPE